MGQREQRTKRSSGAKRGDKKRRSARFRELQKNWNDPEIFSYVSECCDAETRTTGRAVLQHVCTLCGQDCDARRAEDEQ